MPTLSNKSKELKQKIEDPSSSLQVILEAQKELEEIKQKTALQQDPNSPSNRQARLNKNRCTPCKMRGYEICRCGGGGGGGSSSDDEEDLEDTKQISQDPNRFLNTFEKADQKLVFKGKNLNEILRKLLKKSKISTKELDDITEYLTLSIDKDIGTLKLTFSKALHGENKDKAERILDAMAKLVEEFKESLSSNDKRGISIEYNGNELIIRMPSQKLFNQFISNILANNNENCSEVKPMLAATQQSQFNPKPCSTECKPYSED